MSDPIGTPTLEEPLEADLLALAFETSADAICMLGPDGAFLRLNHSASEEFGPEDPSLSAPRLWSEVWDQPFQQQAASMLVRASLGERVQMLATRSAGSNHPQRWQSRIVPLARQGAEAPTLLAISRNVSAELAATDALERSEKVHRALIEATSEIVWHYDTVSSNTDRQGWLEFTGGSDDPHDVDGWLHFLHPDDRAQAKLATDEAMLGAKPLLISYRLRHHSGEYRWVEDQAAPLLDEEGCVSDWVGVISDVHDRRMAEAALRASEERLRLAVEATGLAIWELDLVSGRQSVSSEFLAIMRLPDESAATLATILDRVHPEDRQGVESAFRTTIATGTSGGWDTVPITFRLLFPSGEERWVESRHRVFHHADGTPIRHVGTVQDITSRKLAEQEIWLAAYRDSLTRIPNRALFQVKLDSAIAAAQVEGGSVGVIMVDLDNFKDINDSLGHDAGDALLRVSAERLLALCPSSATVARLGGDEFGIVVPFDGQSAELESLVGACVSTLRQPIEHESKHLKSTASLGWALFPDQDGDAKALLKNADLALYAAKAAGRNAALSFEPGMRAEATRRVTVLRTAEDALGRDAILPFYQPKISLTNGRVLGFEALLRWTDKRGLHSPGAISEAFDDPSLALRIGARMLERVVRDMRDWTDQGLFFGHVAINVGAPEFRGDESGRDLPSRLTEALASANLPPSSLHVEITERVLLDNDADLVAPALRRLAQKGIRIALDDFGTGYASLTHLQQYPVSYLKIDRSFVSEMETDKGAMAIVRALVGLARSLKITPIAEGVETPSQLAALRRTGCDAVQGFLFGKPMIGTRVRSYLAEFPSQYRTITAHKTKLREVQAG